MELAYSLTSSIMFYIVAVLGFVAMKYTMSSKKPGHTDSSWMIQAAFIFLTLLAQIIINFSNAKTICRNSSQSFFVVLLYTLMPYFLIIGTVMAMVTVFPGWLSPFSNTIGYLMVSLMGLNGTFNALLNTDGKGPLLTKICSDESMIINEMNKNNYSQFMKEMSKGNNVLKSTYEQMPQYNKLYGLILLKNIIAEGIWYLLAGCLAISVSSHAIMNIQCDYSPKEMQSISSEIQAQQAKFHASQKKPVLYTKHT